MKKIKLGHSGLEVSQLCMGSDILGSKHDSKVSFAVLDAFRERGGTFLDTGKAGLLNATSYIRMMSHTSPVNLAVFFGIR